MKRLIQIGKLSTIVFWAAVTLNLVAPFAPPAGPILFLGGPIIISIHTFEAFFFIRKFKNQIPELSAHAVQVLLFGFFHFLEVMQQQKTST